MTPWRNHMELVRMSQAQARLIDTTMLFTPASGGVKRYLLAKRGWLTAHRPGLRHWLVLPEQAWDEADEDIRWVRSTAINLGGGYKWPLRSGGWMDVIEQARPTLIEAGDPYAPGVAALRAGRRMGVPVIGFCHTDVATLVGIYAGRLAERAARALWVKRCRQFDAILAPSRYMAGLLEDAGVPRVHAMPLGVDVETFRPALRDAEALRLKLGLSGRDRVLVFAGRNAPEKRLDVLVEMVERLGEPYKLLLIGPGEAGPRSGRVISLPFEPSSEPLAALLASADVFVHANPHETLGLAVLEAMACGRPVVGPDRGGVGEVVDRQVGALAQGASAEALAEAVSDVFSRDWRALGQAARRRAVQVHSWDAAFERLTGFYAQLSGDERFAAAPQGLAQAGG
jgi:alpha-1,6-mannosyltransferase